MATLEKVRVTLPRYLNKKVQFLRLYELRSQIHQDGEMIIQMHPFKGYSLGRYIDKLLFKETDLLTWDERTKAVLEWEYDFIIAECDKIRMINRKRGKKII